MPKIKTTREFEANDIGGLDNYRGYNSNVLHKSSPERSKGWKVEGENGFDIKRFVGQKWYHRTQIAKDINNVKKRKTKR